MVIKISGETAASDLNEQIPPKYWKP